MNPQHKICPGCSSLFEARPNAQACSARCRKRIFRAKQALHHEVQKLAELRQAALTDIQNSLIPPKLAIATAQTPPDFDSDISLEPPDQLSTPESFETSFANTGLISPTPTFITPQASPPPITLQPQPPVQPEPTIQSLETKPTPAHWQQLQNSWQLPTQATNPQPPAIDRAPTEQTEQTPPNPIEPSNDGPRFSNWFKRPLGLALSFVTLIALISGTWVLTGLLHQTKPTTPNLSSQTTDNSALAAKDSVLSLNLDTVIAKGKSLTLGQIIAGPGSSILHITGDVQTTGTLYASNGQSSLSNSGLTINNVVVCTTTGCKDTAAAASTAALTSLLATATLQGNSFNTANQLVQLTTAGILPVLSGTNLTTLNATNLSSGTLADTRLSTNVTLQGNTFNGISQLVQLTTAGILPVLSGTNLTTLNATNLSSGTLADTRLSTNVALLNGSPLFKNSTNSTTAFQIQNAAGTSNLLIADTLSTRIGIGNLTPTYTLDVAGDINSSTGVRVGGALLCNSGGCTASGGSNSYIQNATALQTANFNIQSATTTSVTGTIRATTSQSADLLQLKDQAGVNVLTIGSTGNSLIQPSTNSINAFAVQNALGTSLLIGADTLNARVAIATAVPPNYTLDVGGDINSSTGLRVAGNLVCSTTCTPGGGSGSYIQNGTAVQTANFAIQSDLNSHIVAYIRGASGQSADLLDVVGKGAGDVNLPVATFSASGNILFQNAIDSTTAFRLQNLAGNNYLLVNTSGASISLGDTAIASTIQIGNTTGAVAQTVNIGNNTTASSATTVVLGSTIGTSPLTIQAGSSGLTTKTTSTTALVIQKADGTGTIFTADTSGATITLGSAGATPVLLVLGTKNTAGDPTCTAGAIYYNSSAAAFRGCQDVPSGFTNLGNPAGTVVAFAGSSAPSGYLIADGSCVPRATYTTLFAIIGTTYSDNATTACSGADFNLPDLKGRSAVGLNTSQTTRTDVTALGKNEGAVIGSRTPYHKSTVVQPTISVVQPTISTPSFVGTPGTTSGSSFGDFTALHDFSGGGNVAWVGGNNMASANLNHTHTFTPVGTVSQPTASGGSASASGGTVGPQTNVPTDAPAYLTLNYLIKY